MHHIQSPRPVSDETIEDDIRRKGLTAPRVTPADIEAEIASEHYYTADDGVRATPEGVELDEIPEPLRLLTFCVLVLRNGFTVTGKSACASPENFDAEIGRRIARQDATNQVWPLLGFMLKQKMYDAEKAAYFNAAHIARICHEVNRAYCQALGDNSQPAWEDAPQWQKDSAANGVRLHLSGEHGPEASHESWMAEKIAAGWRYGQSKDAVLKTHPCILPFNQLPTEQQAKDFIFRGVVQAMVQASIWKP